VLNTKFYSVDQIKRVEGQGFWKLRGMGKAVHELVWRPEVNRLLVRSRRRCEDVNKVDLQGIVWECLDWIVLARGNDTWRPFV
jgi:hypothetical protein